MSLRFTPRERANGALLIVLGCSIVLAAVTALFELEPEMFRPGYIGPDDGLRFRLLRLARISAVALPVLTFLFAGLASRADPRSRAARWGGSAMLWGTIGMPAILAAAGFTRIELRLLLPLPAGAIFSGTLCGLWLSKRHAQPSETWGWFLIALSMGAGLLMGLYAFDAPLLPADLAGAYNDSVRRLIRQAHVGCILLGFSTIFFCRNRERRS